MKYILKRTKLSDARQVLNGKPYILTGQPSVFSTLSSARHDEEDTDIDFDNFWADSQQEGVLKTLLEDIAKDIKVKRHKEFYFACNCTEEYCLTHTIIERIEEILNK